MTTIIPPEPSHVKRDPGQLVEMAWDPITRIVGSLGIYTKIDFDNREVVECHSTSSIFRGYSIFMKGKDPPRDAHFITSRICGICGDNHATCSCYAQNMAYGVQPPRMSPNGSSTSARPRNTCSTTTSSRRTWSGSTTARRWSPRPTRAFWPRRRTPSRRARTCTGTGPSPTSCARSTRSPATSTARHCRSAGGPGRCSA